ncbi:MAG: hypothetical protein MR227_01920 [Firmicutes bacterium]|nr:hypothetical protein [Bacillota bacterium]
MKNAINYYYQLYPLDIHQKDKKFIFSIDDTGYVLIPYIDDAKRIGRIEYILKILDYNQIKYNQIIKNTANTIVTYISNIPYVLIKININNQNNVIISDIIEFQNYMTSVLTEKIDINNLSSLWMDKVDYFEYQVSQFGIKFPIIRHSFNYFIGLAENAIMVINSISKKEIVGTISHFRVSVSEKITDLYNPLNFVIDSKIRDISEYLKGKMFFYDISSEFSYYFNLKYFSNDEIILFLARMLYPTYYFDVCENSIEANNEDTLKIIVSKVSLYEQNIKYIYNYLRKMFQIPEIGWLLS